MDRSLVLCPDGGRHHADSCASAGGCTALEPASVTCNSCHGEDTADHPKSPMPVDRSPDLCGRCHSDTRFGWQDWQGSTHYQRGKKCTTCHDAERASL